MTIKFEENSVKEAEDYYRNVHLDAQQRGFLENFSKVFSQSLSLPDRALRGFMWFAIKDWQVEHKKDISDLVGVSSEQRLKGGLEVANIFKKKLKRILIDPSQESKLDEVINNVTEMFKREIKK